MGANDWIQWKKVKKSRNSFEAWLFWVLRRRLWRNLWLKYENSLEWPRSTAKKGHCREVIAHPYELLYTWKCPRLWHQISSICTFWMFIHSKLGPTHFWFCVWNQNVFLKYFFLKNCKQTAENNCKQAHFGFSNMRSRLDHV